MCGIAGIISTTQNLPQEQVREALDNMQAALKHRGPDGQGQFFSSTGSAALCHTRLSIIDLSSAGHQPMMCDHQRYTITFNGEIYNYQALRSELENNGEVFTSNSDTEVLLKLYKLEGPTCVNKLRGMFAFLIWDEVEQHAFAARDSLGIKPFYYSHYDDGTFAFASELRSLMSAKLHTSNLSPEGTNSYFLTGTVAEPETLLADASLLSAGTTLTLDNGKLSTKPYWVLPHYDAQTSPITSDSQQVAIDTVRAALESTVKAHFVSDVPVGIFLSGGIDSSALVALAKKVTDAKINTYSIAFESPDWNEGDIAKRVSEHFGTHHTELLVTPELAKPLFNDFLTAVDQPTIDGFNTYCVSRLAKQAGEKVVLSGVGGDELFAGYKSFELLPKMHTWGKRLTWLSPIANVVNRALTRQLSSKWQRTLDFLSKPVTIPTAHQCLRGIFSQQEALSLCASMNLTGKPNNNTRDTTHQALPQREQISEQELTTYMRNQLLRDSDVMSMACGLELRVPFVDRELVEALATIPPDIRLQLGKKLLIEAVPELPHWIINRPKQGFRFPFDEWFASEWGDMPTPQTVPTWIKLTPWYRQWSLLVLNDWQARHLDQHTTES